MTDSEIKAQVFLRIEEDPTDPAFWEIAEVEEAINDGWEDLALHAQWYLTRYTVPLQDEITYYDTRDFPEEIVKVVAIWDLATGRWLVPHTVTQLQERRYYRWESVTGTPDAWFVRGAFQLGVFPKPAVADAAHMSPLVEIHAAAIPPKLAFNSYTLPYPEEFHEANVLYALYDLKSQEGEADVSLQYWDQYVLKREAFKQWVRDYGSKAMLRHNRESSS